MPSVKGTLYDGRTSQRLTTKLQFITVTTGFASANVVIRPAFKEVYSSIDGSFNVRLDAGRYVVKCGGITLTEIVVPSGEGTYGIDALIVTGTVAPASGNFLQLTGGTMTGDIIMSHLTADRVALIDSTKRIYSSSITTTTLGYLDATSSIQTQLNTKAAGAASSTDNAIARFDGTTGKVLQNSWVTMDDTGQLFFSATSANEADPDSAMMTFRRSVAGDIGRMSWGTGGILLSSDYNITLSPTSTLQLGGTVNVTGLTASQIVLTDASKNLVSGTSANAYALVTAANYAAMRALLDVEPGIDFLSPAAIASAYQPLDATLTALAGLTIAANTLTIGTGADAFSQTTFAPNTFPARASTGSLVAKPITNFGLSLVDDADAATARTTLNAPGLGSYNGFTASQAITDSTSAIYTLLLQKFSGDEEGPRIKIQKGGSTAGGSGPSEPVKAGALLGELSFEGAADEGAGTFYYPEVRIYAVAGNDWPDGAPGSKLSSLITSAGGKTWVYDSSGNSSFPGNLYTGKSSDDATSAFLNFSKSRVTGDGALDSGDELGEIYFYGDYGAGSAAGAWIDASAGADWTSSSDYKTTLGLHARGASGFRSLLLGNLGFQISIDGNFTQYIDDSRNIGFNTSSFGSSAAKVLSIGVGTAPNTSPADVVQMWVDDVFGSAGNAGLNVLTEIGTKYSLGSSMAVDSTDLLSGIYFRRKESSGATEYGDVIMFLRGHAWDGTAYDDAGGIFLAPSENWSSTTRGSRLLFEVCEKGNNNASTKLWIEDKFLFIPNGSSSTGPSTFPYTDGFYFWSQDRAATAGKGSLGFRAEDGTQHLLGDRVGLGTLTPGYFLDVVGDMRVGAASGAAGSRIIGRGEHTSAPAASLATGEWELSVYDNGVSPVLRVRYNDAGTTRVGDVALV